MVNGILAVIQTTISKNIGAISFGKQRNTELGNFVGQMIAVRNYNIGVYFYFELQILIS